MSYSFHPEAEEEFIEAIAYYESCEPGLGLDFSRQVHATIRNVVDYPTLWPAVEAKIRRCLVNRFPYGVLYSIKSDGVLILAVMHLHRDPTYWKRRTRTGERSD
jgi:plasmid stabilization system protein ParE